MYESSNLVPGADPAADPDVAEGSAAEGADQVRAEVPRASTRAKQQRRTGSTPGADLEGFMKFDGAGACRTPQAEARPAYNAGDERAESLGKAAHGRVGP